MKTITFNVIKKNRKYFAAEKDGYKCKILIDSNSENLELGEQSLTVEDISVRSKYGVDLIYKLSVEASEQAEAGICTLQHSRFNANLVEACRLLGGRWDASSKAWVFPSFVAEQVEELDYIYNSELVTVELTACGHIFRAQAPVRFLGYEVATAHGRDSGAKLGEDVALIAGRVSSGGSVKNWGTVCDEGSKFLMNVPSELLKSAEISQVWSIKEL